MLGDELEDKVLEDGKEAETQGCSIVPNISGPWKSPGVREEE